MTQSAYRTLAIAAAIAFVIVIGAILAIGQLISQTDPAISVAAQYATELPSHVQRVSGVGTVLNWEDPTHPGIVCYYTQPYTSLSCVRVAP